MRLLLLVSLLTAGCAGADPGPPAAAMEDTFAHLLAQTNAKVEQFQFSPDGSRISYVSSKNGSSDIWVMNADGSDARAITDAYPEAEADPRWSPDGEWIAFVTRHCGTGCWRDIFVTRADGSIPPIDLSYGRGGAMPRWTSDGKSIVFQSLSENGYYHMATLAADIPVGGPVIRALTSGPDNYSDPQISPDGKWLAFASTRTERAGGPRVSGVWVLPLGGGTPRLLVEGGDRPRWSPDAPRIAFASIVDGWRNIGVVDVASADTKILTDDAWDSANPQWSPDSQWIGYVSLAYTVGSARHYM